MRLAVRAGRRMRTNSAASEFQHPPSSNARTTRSMEKLGAGPLLHLPVHTQSGACRLTSVSPGQASSVESRHQRGINSELRPKNTWGPQVYNLAVRVTGSVHSPERIGSLSPEVWRHKIRSFLDGSGELRFSFSCPCVTEREASDLTWDGCCALLPALLGALGLLTAECAAPAACWAV